MRVGIFVVMAGRQAGGPETYEHCLVREIAALDRENEYHIFCLERGAAESFGIQQPNVRYHTLWPRNRWISVSTSLPLCLIRHRLDLYHATFTPPPFSPVDLVFTMHCASTFVRPDLYPRDVLRRLDRLIVKGIKKAKLIICVSRNVRDLTAEHYGVPRERLAVVYHGASACFRPVPDDEVRRVLGASYNLRHPYVLFVGKIIERKNVVRLLEAFHRFRQEADGDLKLVMVGRRTWVPAAFDETIARLDLREHVVEIGHLRHEELPMLYSGAEMFVLPSLWEGFGMPLIEAMACATPVITSNVSCLPEIAGKAALLVDPYSAEEIAEAMHQIHTDASLRASLREKGLARARMFSWRRAARQTRAAYERVADL